MSEEYEKEKESCKSFKKLFETMLSEASAIEENLPQSMKKEFHKSLINFKEIMKSFPERAARLAVLANEGKLSETDFEEEFHKIAMEYLGKYLITKPHPFFFGLSFVYIYGTKKVLSDEFYGKESEFPFYT
jgi:hypothetical protein